MTPHALRAACNRTLHRSLLAAAEATADAAIAGADYRALARAAESFGRHLAAAVIVSACLAGLDIIAPKETP